MTGVLFITQTFKPQLASTYFHSKKWEEEGKVYKRLGVNEFRKILVWIGWEKLNKASKPVKRSLDGLNHLEYSTRLSEFGHLIIFYIVLILTIFVGLYYGFKESLWLIILNILLNAYPVIVQRFNRPRLQNVINQLDGFKPGNKI